MEDDLLDMGDDLEILTNRLFPLKANLFTRHVVHSKVCSGVSLPAIASKTHVPVDG